MVVCLLLDLGLKATFELEGEVVLKNGDPLDQPPDQPFIGGCLIAAPLPLAYYAVIFTSQASMNRRSPLA